MLILKRNDKYIRTRCYNLKDAEKIMHLMIAHGFEGVQNDSYRYCRDEAMWALESGGCWICADAYSIRVSNIHDTYGKHKFLDVGPSKFIEYISSIMI